MGWRLIREVEADHENRWRLMIKTGENIKKKVDIKDLYKKLICKKEIDIKELTWSMLRLCLLILNRF